MGKLTEIIYISLLTALLICGCASSNRYVSTSVKEEDDTDTTETDMPPLAIETEPDAWPNLEIFQKDTTYTSVDTAAANRAMRLRWGEVAEILEEKSKITIAEAFLLARAYHETEQYNNALDLYSQVMDDTAFVIYPYAQIGAAEALASMDSIDKAMVELESLPEEFMEQGLSLKYDILLSNDMYFDALAVLDSIESLYPSHFDNMEYRLARANLQLNSGDTISAMDGYRHILLNNNGSYALAVADILDDFDELKGRDLYYAGKAAANRRRWSNTLDYLGRYIETGEKYRRGEARYYYARAMSKRGAYAKAIDLYREIIEDKAYNKAWAELGIAWCNRKLKRYDSAREYIHMAIADGAGTNAEAEALWEAVELFIDLGDYDSTGYYAYKLSRRFPNHSLGDNGAMWSGLGPFAEGKYATAQKRFSFIDKQYSDRKFTEAGQYWTGISYLEADDSTGIDFLEEIAKSPVRHYYKYRAISQLNRIELPDPTKSNSSEWMTYSEGIARAGAALEEMGHEEIILSINTDNARMAEVFAAMGLLYEAEYYLKKWMSEMDMNPSIRIAFLETAVDWRLSGEAYQISLKLVSDLGGYANVPIEVIRLAYPTIFEKYIRAAAHVENIDPAFIFAIIRRESAFDPHVESYAGAIGLCQFMPATAEVTADQLGDGDIFQTGLLYDFETSVRYAARHIAELASLYEKPEYILAAYNAGPHHLDRWRDFPHNQRIELFVESVDFAQTRHYIKNVLGDYWAYKELWDRSIQTPSN